MVKRYAQCRPLAELPKGTILYGTERRVLRTLCGNYMRDIRVAAGVSQSEAAAVLRITQPGLSYIEKGEDSTLTVDKLLTYSILYGVDPVDVLGEIIRRYDAHSLSGIDFDIPFKLRRLLTAAKGWA